MNFNKKIDRHLVIAFFSCIVFSLFVYAIDNWCSDDNTAAASISSQDTLTESVPLPQTVAESPAPESAPSPPVVKFTAISGEILSGDNLNTSLGRLNISSELRRRIIGALAGCMDFRRLRPHDTYSILLDDQNKLVSFKYESGPLDIYMINRAEDNSLFASKLAIPLECRTVKLSGIINYSLFNAFLDQGEEPGLIYAFADIFASKIDFNTETRQNDAFSLIVEKYFKDDNFVRYGRILYARYERQNGKILEGFHYAPDPGQESSYFDQDGIELGANFIRSPVPVGRISSRFTFRRKHPITGRIRPHLGIDLAAPIGTPVMAAADGRVRFVGRKGGFGKQVILEHGGGYRTYYGHLSRFRKGMRKGRQVKQKEIIGYVGSTGVSTGPHLDYRLQHLGVYKNPFSIDFRPKSILRGEEIALFREAIKPYMEMAEHPDEHRILFVKHVSLTPESKLVFL